MNRTLSASLGAALALSALLLGSLPANAQVAPSLGTAASYAMLGTNPIPIVGTATCTTSTVNGDVGSTFTGPPPMVNTGCTINGDVVAPVPASVVTDFDAAYGALDTANPCTGVIPTVDTILPPGVYCSPAGVALTSITLTLSGAPGSVWVFKVGTGGLGALEATSLTMLMAGGADACDVYWRTAEAATVTTSTFIGTVLAGTAVTVTGGSFLGQAQAGTDVTVSDTEVGGCARGNGPVAEPIPALGPAAMAGLIALLAGLGLIALRKP